MKIVAALVLLGGLFPAFGQETAIRRWDNLRSLRQGEKIDVVDQNLKKYRGNFAAFSDAAISLRVGQDRLSVDRESVLRVTSREESKRRRNALLGAAIGVAAGLTTGAIYCHGDCDLARGVAWGYPMIMGAGLGGGLGALVPSRPTVYRAKKH